MAPLAMSDPTVPTITIIIPSYRRPEYLSRCLTSIASQILPPTEVLVVCRVDDPASEAITTTHGAKIVSVSSTGVVAAMNAGLRGSTGDIVGLLDDDVVVPQTWLAELSRWFADSNVGGAGGRDRVFANGCPIDAPRTTHVGVLRPHGRVVGNHHLGQGAPKSVDVLKGCNLLLRRAAVTGFDERMCGSGAQVHWELALCLSMRRCGWSLIYDPTVEVDHYPAPRFDEDQRNSFNGWSVHHAAHNETLALLDHLPVGSLPAYWLWALLIGNASSPGLVQALRRRDPRGLWFSIRGRLAALRTRANARCRS